MPVAVLKSIREVSSEDKLHCASNLLQNESTKKWKTGEPGEKSAYVIIEMKEDYLIKGIDIGNECSAFVEVLVGTETCPRDKFKEILITCSFMTPTESKVCSVPNRVRCFGREALVEQTAADKWKLLKVVCSQPFNKDVNYGLSFIKVHVEDSPKTKVNNNQIKTSTILNKTIGSFNLREESPDSESESTTSLFNRWKNSKNKEPNGISTVPRIPSPAALKKPVNSPIIKKTITPVPSSAKKESTADPPVVHDRNRNSLLFPDEDDDEQSVQEKRKKKLEKLEKVIAADQERVKKENEKAKNSKKPQTPKNDSKKDRPNTSLSEKEKPSKAPNSPKSAKKPNTPSSSTSQRRQSSSPCVSDKPKKPKLDKPLQYKPFNQLLQGVVLVISGIQNPDRTDLRNKALALGAKYKADWDGSSTHLICAFKNTPKYNQVKGIGKIVTRKWIEDCYNKKRKIPWRRYALDSDETHKNESEDEILDESLKPPENRDIQPVEQRKNSDDDDEIRKKYDNMDTNNSQYISSGSDTEDEIQRVLAKNSPQGKPAQTRDVFEVSTEEEDYVKRRKLSQPDKTTYFKNMKFIISDELSATLKIKVERYIDTFGGVLARSIDEADYVIAENLSDDVGAFKGETVSPLWILECYDSECLIPTKRYLVT